MNVANVQSHAYIKEENLALLTLTSSDPMTLHTLSGKQEISGLASASLINSKVKTIELYLKPSSKASISINENSKVTNIKVYVIPTTSIRSLSNNAKTSSSQISLEEIKNTHKISFSIHGDGPKPKEITYHQLTTNNV